MKALVYTQANEVRLLERDAPAMAPGEVVLRIDAVGICGSDMHAYHGHDPRRLPGLVLGHEFAGTVLGSAHPMWRAGMRVTGNPLITCGHCEYCVQGRDNLCARRTMVGMTRPGAFAEQMGIPGQCLIALPDTLGALQAALTEPAATALHAINLSMKSLVRPLPECRVLVLGGGAIGMLAALLLRHYGVDRLEVAEVNPLRRTSLQQHARCVAFDPLERGADDNAFDYVIDAVGSIQTRQSALAAVKPGGVVMHIGLQDWASEIDMRKLTLAEITLLGTYTYSTADLRATVAALDRGVFGDLSWVERRPLSQGAQAFDDLHHGRLASAKVVLEPGA
ncbi:MAG: galactitol-1-phosphate 5-dehydrogenase [Ideonella sp.]|jgi:threonine dehydrogenase-like Zn-dependent dehydrogenase|nr:galactitol-1-phosphate 5-dehydrogenase [Ideonella sp.]